MDLVEIREKLAFQGESVVDVEGVKIILEPNIPALCGMYGSLVVDYFKSFFSSGFVVGFEGARC
jgi:hypothetical protein